MEAHRVAGESIISIYDGHSIDGSEEGEGL